MVVSAASHSPVAATPHEHERLVQAVELLEQSDGHEVKSVAADGQCVVLPETAQRLLRDVVQALARDQAVAVLPVQKRLTPNMAAAILNVSGSYLVRLLDEGAFPSTGTGDRRRVRFEDLMAYKDRRDRERREALDEMVRLGEEMGLYEWEAEGKLNWPDERDSFLP